MFVMMLFKYTARDIQLMDFVFFDKWTGTKSGAEYFMQEYKMSRDEYMFVEKEILTIGESLGLIKVEWFDDGSGEIVTFYGHMCDKFYYAGGFNGYFQPLNKTSVNEPPRVKSRIPVDMLPTNVPPKTFRIKKSVLFGVIAFVAFLITSAIGIFPNELNRYLKTLYYGDSSHIKPSRPDIVPSNKNTLPVQPHKDTLPRDTPAKINTTKNRPR